MTPNPNCPWCGARSADVTTVDRTGPRIYICIGSVCHEFTESDIPLEYDPEPEQDRPSLIRRLIERLI